MPRDFLADEILRADMQTMYAARAWGALRGKSVYCSGAAGMIASYLVMFLIFLNEEHGYGVQIYAGVRTEQKARARFGAYVDRAYFHVLEGDVNAPFASARRMDYLIHAASPASPQFYGGNPVETMLPNAVGSYHILEHARKTGTDGVLFFSSGAVYGTVEGDLVSETACGAFDFLAPGSVYGESKRFGEALGNAYWREYKVPFRSVRIHHVYGPTLDLQHDRRAFAEFVKNIVDGRDIVLMSDGRQKRAFCYLTDAIVALMTVLIDGASGESYNLANKSQFVSIAQLAEILTKLYPEKKLSVVRQARQESGYLALAQTNDVVCDTQKIQALGCKFGVSIEEGFRRTIAFFSRAT